MRSMVKPASGNRPSAPVTACSTVSVYAWPWVATTIIRIASAIAATIIQKSISPTQFRGCSGCSMAVLLCRDETALRVWRIDPVLHCGTQVERRNPKAAKPGAPCGDELSYGVISHPTPPPPPAPPYTFLVVVTLGCGSRRCCASCFLPIRRQVK